MEGQQREIYFVVFIEKPPRLIDTVQKLVVFCCYMLDRITESQNSRGWKGPLWVI